MFRRLCLLAAGLLLAAEPPAANAAAPCLTPTEFTAFTEFALPGIVTGARTRCVPVLGGDSFLAEDGKAFADHLAASSASAWPSAKAALIKLVSTGDPTASAVVAAMPDDSLRQMLAGTIAGVVVARLPPERCAAVDRIVGALAPLPPRNTAALVATLFALGTEKKGGAKLGGPLGVLSICPAE